MERFSKIIIIFSVYGDCCSDATSQAKLEKDADFQLWRSYWWSCRKVAAEIPSPHYLMVSYCPAFWKDEYTQRLCRNYNLYDRLVNWPVHDASNGALFKNVFCAKCNGVEEVVFWSANIHCKKDFFHFKRKDALPAARGNVTAFQVKLVRNPAKTLISPQQQIRIQRRIELNNVSMADEMDRLMAEATLQRMDSATKADCALQFVPVSVSFPRVWTMAYCVICSICSTVFVLSSSGLHFSVVSSFQIRLRFWLERGYQRKDGVLKR